MHVHYRLFSHFIVFLTVATVLFSHHGLRLSLLSAVLLLHESVSGVDRQHSQVLVFAEVLDLAALVARKLNRPLLVKFLVHNNYNFN